ncbi:zinc-binding metallopeptidase family protein [Saccharospirillum mangrovi]|uniref:zinc-binding metallopeptidase family protein n=1 Tax=Saccharospirillum mangrovi TaxID=2161747 RepID=UPI000D37A368|nr:putative zinc-binding metallopeptidase [Saccharospirillum mangrovi]
MQLFRCENCGQRLYFDNTRCVHCGAHQGFDPDTLSMKVYDPAAAASVGHYRACTNARQVGICNWLIPPSSDASYCLSCRLSMVIPDLGVPGHIELWASLEEEKRRLLYSLLSLKLPLVSRQQDPVNGLGFRFMADAPDGDSERVLIGHQDGIITLNIAEADPVVREATRRQMAEPYRTILGHFRHEAGHYYWQLLVKDSDHIEPFRRRFGDERQDYAQALERQYQIGPMADWQQYYVSAYASAHPWEDWAETWAHYLHMVDTLDTAYQFGLSTAPRPAQSVEVQLNSNPYRDAGFDTLIAQWLPLTAALNSLNHSMGYDDVYPFSLSAAVIDKLAMVHGIIHGLPIRQGVQTN